MKAFILATLLMLVTFGISQAQCAKIKDGTIKDVNGNTITLGFDKYGYNYQAHMFNGLYDNYSRPALVATEGLVNLQMKWSDDWLANINCNSDLLLDRGGPGGDGTSKGWLTNHEEGDYSDPTGGTHHYTYFVKIVYDGGTACRAIPTAASCIWGVYTVIEEVMNDPDGGVHGVDRSKLVNPAGLGFYTN